MDKDTIVVTSPLLPDLDEFHQMLREIWDRKWVTNNGVFHKKFEELFYMKIFQKKSKNQEKK